MLVFTVKDVVSVLKQIFPTADDVQISRSLQHWTNLGILTAEPISLHQGSGKHRRYALQQVYLAAIFWGFKWLQLQAGPMKRLAAALLAKDQTHQIFEQAALEKGRVFIYSPPDDAKGECPLVIPLHAVLSRVRWLPNT